MTNQTKTELKNVKYFAAGSHETYCFTASIYVNGKKAGTAENSGHGGPTDYYWDNKELGELAEAYVKTLPEIVTDLKDETAPDGLFRYKQDMGGFIYSLLTEHLAMKDFKRDIGKRILFVRDGALYQTKCVKKAHLVEHLKKGEELVKHFGADKVLNLLPESEAFALYQELAA